MCREKILDPAFFKVSVDYLFDNLESGKEIIVLEKCLEKILNFGSKNNTIPKEGDWSFHFLPLTLIVIYFF